MHLKSKSLCAIFFIMIFMIIAALAIEDKNKGAHQLDIFGGFRGYIPFLHHMHMGLKNCDICHLIFPKIPGSIKDLKGEGKLTKKHVMKNLCIKCHKAEKKAGNKSSPTICTKCHIKNKYYRSMMK